MDRRGLLLGGLAALVGAFLPRLRRRPEVMLKVTYRASACEYHLEVIGSDDPQAVVEWWKEGMARIDAEVLRDLCGPDVDVSRFVGRVS